MSRSKLKGKRILCSPCKDSFLRELMDSNRQENLNLGRALLRFTLLHHKKQKMNLTLFEKLLTLR